MQEWAALASESDELIGCLTVGGAGVGGAGAAGE